MCAKIHRPWSTFELPNFQIRTFNFLLKCCDPNAMVGEDSWGIFARPKKIPQRPDMNHFKNVDLDVGLWWVLFGFLGMMSATIHFIEVYKSLEARNWIPIKKRAVVIRILPKNPPGDFSMATFWTGQGDGDPHIHSLRGAHYTLLSQGNFVAWSYSKQTAGTEAELFASYAGSRFTTQALALKTKGSKAEMLEITAHDCQWRAQSSDSDQWLETETKDFSQSNLEVPTPTKEQGRLYMHASIILKTSLSPVRKLAKLMTRCKPGDHLDFKVEMFHKDDLQYIGGQLGAAPGDQKTAMLSSGLTRLKTDAQFKAGLGEWLQLCRAIGNEEGHVRYRTSELDDGWPESVEEQGLLLLALRHYTNYKTIY